MASTILVGAEQISVPYPHVPPSIDKVTIKVYDSTFNQLADKIAPLQLQGHYAYGVTTCLPGTGLCNTTTICSSDWMVKVTQLRFAIRPDGIGVTGKGDAAWCGVAGSFTLETTADATHAAMMHILDSRPGGFQRTEAVLVTLTPTSVQPVLTLR